MPKDAADPAHQKKNLSREQRELKVRFERILTGVRKLVADQANYRTVSAVNSSASMAWNPLVYFTNAKGELDTHRSSIAINKTTSFNINLWGITYSEENAFISKPIFTMNTSFHKKIKNLDVTVNYNDVFKSLQFTEAYNLRDLNVNSTFFTDVNELSISLKYNLGEIKKSNYKSTKINDTHRIR